MENKDLQINQQQLSYVISGILILSFFIFLSGYYWGKKSAIEVWTDQLKAESLADKLYCAFCSFNETTDEYISQANTESIAQAVKIHEDFNKIQGKENKKSYYAQLAGFNSLKRAQNCIEKLKSYNVKLVERKSKTSKGKLYKWYQIVTESTDNLEELNKQVEIIKKVAKLKNPIIATLDTTQK